MQVTVAGFTFFNEVNYTLIPVDDCVALGQKLHENGGRWHIHVFPPDCQYNPFASQYAMVIEDDDNNISYIARSDTFPEADKVLVKLLHGDDITDAKHGACCDQALADEPILLFIESLETKKEAWHHHMFFPSCDLNPEAGRWTIVVESALDDFIVAFDDEPVAVLGVIESIFFASLEN